MVTSIYTHQGYFDQKAKLLIRYFWGHPRRPQDWPLVAFAEKDLGLPKATRALVAGMKSVRDTSTKETVEDNLRVLAQSFNLSDDRLDDIAVV